MTEGDVLAGRYRIVRWIASGGMGSVWEATDTVLGQQVALKHVTFAGLSTAAADESRRRTLREARNAARLRGERDIIAIYDVLDVDDGVWLVLEYLPSESLGDVLDRVGRLPVPEVARIGAAVADALAAAHRSGVVHRDVKPRNVLIAHDDGRVKLTDFGISHAEDDPRVTASNALTGTPAYMAREVAAGDGSTAASDVFSLASTLYRAVEGVTPFGGDDGNVHRTLLRVATGMLRPPEIAGPLTPLLGRMFDVDPARRPTAASVAAELRTAPDARPSPAPPPPGRTATLRQSPPAPARRPRRRTVLVAGGLALAALVTAGAVVVPRLTGPATVADLEPVTTFAVPADAVRPAGTGRAVCSGLAIAYAGSVEGENARLGVNIVNAVTLAVTQHNRANPGCQVRLVRSDTGGTADTAPPVVNALIANPDVVGVVGLPFSGESRNTGSLFEQAGLAHLTPSATSPALTGNGWTTFFRMLGNDTTQGPAAARLLTGRLGVERVCVIRDDSQYATGIADAAIREMGDVVDPACGAAVATDQTDMSTAVSQVTATGADAVLFAGYYTEAAPLVQQLRAAGFRGRFVTTDGSDDPLFTGTAGAAAENAYVLCPCAPGELATAFASEYSTASGGPPGTYSLEGYDAATALLGAIDAGATDRPGVAAHLRRLDQQAFTKRLRFTVTGEPVDPPMFVYRVVNGRIVYVGPVG